MMIAGFCRTRPWHVILSPNNSLLPFIFPPLNCSHLKALTFSANTSKAVPNIWPRLADRRPTTDPDFRPPFPQTQTMFYTTTLLRWLQRKRYQYEVTFSLYMLTPTEKIIFSTPPCLPARSARCP